MLVKPDCRKALSPIVITLSGIITLVKLVQSENTALPMFVTATPPNVDGIVKLPLNPVGAVNLIISASFP